jgi:hypothetical protein
MRHVRTAALAATLAGLVFTAAPSFAKDPPAPTAAKNVVTVFVNKGSAGAVTKEINKVHAKMEAEGWVYRDMGVYTEDGDLEGIFVTYVKPHPPMTPPAPAAAPAAPASPAAPAAPSPAN